MMKTRVMIMGTIILPLLLSACQEPNQPPVRQTINNTDILLTEGGAFPAELAGVWIADREDWQILLQPDGSIASCLHTVGRVPAKPGQTTQVPLSQEGMGLVEAGKWSTQYTRSTRELAVEIVINRFTFAKAADVIEGKSRDLFVGRVSNDGKTWTAEWTTQPEYTVTTDTDNQVKLPMDEEGQIMGPITFTRQPIP
jgi:hypothetical protein